MKTLFVTIQIDEFKLADLEELEEKLQEVFSEYLRKRIQISVQDSFGPPIPRQD
jgi:ribosomal protein L29